MATVSLVLRREGSFLRPYAMKRFHAPAIRDAELEAMFLDEARIAGLLRHPNVVSVLDVGQDDEGPFLIMDYVEGVTLAQLIRGRRTRDEEPVPMQIGLRILVQAARGLAAAHELRSPSGSHLQLVHRDISPQNILVDLSGTVRVADFGIARATGRATETERGVLKGKLGYLAPETLRFESTDHRADLFALGVVAYELLTGGRLYGASTGDVSEAASRILREPAPDLGLLRPDAPDGLVALLFRLLAKDPDDRPATAREVADILDELVMEVVFDEGAQPLDSFLRQAADLSGVESRQRRVAALETTQETVPTEPVRHEPLRRRKWILPATLGIMAAALAALGWVWDTSSESPAINESARNEPNGEETQGDALGQAQEAPAPVALAQDTEEPSAPVPEPLDDVPDEEAAAAAPAADPASSPTTRRRRSRPRMTSMNATDLPVVRVY